MCALFARTTKRLADSGMSQRQIAKRAGVSQMQVRRDLKRNGSKTETKRHDKEAMDIDVTRCPFAEFFRALGEPELGALLICETDFDIVATGGGAVTLTREQTIMQGAPSCTFRYRFAPRDCLLRTWCCAVWLLHVAIAREGETRYGTGHRCT